MFGHCDRKAGGWEIPRGGARAPGWILSSLTALLLAGVPNGSARGEDTLWGEFAVHRKAPTTKSVTVCGTYSPIAERLPCYEYTSTAPARGYSLVYFVIGWGPTAGVSAASFGIDYDGRPGMKNGLDPSFSDFIPCYDGPSMFYDGGFGNFPAPKGGAFVTWSTCANAVIDPAGVHALIGALSCYAYAEDILRMTPNNVQLAAPELVVVDCNGARLDLTQLPSWFRLSWVLGRVQFGGDGSQGFAGCGAPIGVRPATWGKIKGLFHTP